MCNPYFDRIARPRVVELDSELIITALCQIEAIMASEHNIWITLALYFGDIGVRIVLVLNNMGQFMGEQLSPARGIGPVLPFGKSYYFSKRK